MNPDNKAMFKATAVADQSLTEIGRITVHFALLEWTLLDLTHRLLGLPKRRARAITSELSFRNLQNLASSLLKERRPNRSKEFDEILRRVSACEEKRNVISHSLWGSGGFNSDGTQVIVRTKYTAKQKRGLNFVRQELTGEQLYEIAREISITAYDVEVFGASLRLKRKFL